LGGRRPVQVRRTDSGSGNIRLHPPANIEPRSWGNKTTQGPYGPWASQGFKMIRVGEFLTKLPELPRETSYYPSPEGFRGRPGSKESLGISCLLCRRTSPCVYGVLYNSEEKIEQQPRPDSEPSPGCGKARSPPSSGERRRVGCPWGSCSRAASGGPPAEPSEMLV
jgi:hypothetical protein